MAEEKSRWQIAYETDERFSSERDKALSALKDDEKRFVRYNYDYHCHLSNPQKYKEPERSELIEALRDGLSDGSIAKPSDFLREKCAFLWNGYILPRFKDVFLYAADRINRCQYSGSPWRRSFRSANYAHYFTQLLQLIERFARIRTDKPLVDILTLSLPDDEKVFYTEGTARGLVETITACALDLESEKAVPAVKNILNGESEFTVSHEIIRGICRSENAEAHEYLGRLLTAAQLQEGLRQAICESADCGTAEAFLTILRVIGENNLIRFSSVKRAAGTWTGLLAYDSKDLERISAKTIALMIDCVEDGKKRSACLASEDSMEIYMALWSYGLFEAETAVEKFRALAENGTVHQVLTAGYFAASLNNDALAHRTAKTVIIKRSEPEILAVYLPYFLKNPRMDTLYNFSVRWLPPAAMLRQFFDSREEAERFYGRLKELLASLPKKPLEFSPCIFPWYSASLSAGDVIFDMALIAYMLEDSERSDELCALIKGCGEFERIMFIDLLLKRPQSAVQRNTLVEMLGDRSGAVRDKAFAAVADVTLSDENYLQMEGMLKYKAADMRSRLIDLLYKRGDDALFGTVSRLLADNSEEKRTAGLDLVMRMSEDKDKAALLAKCRPLCAELSSPSSKEKILLDVIIGGSAAHNAVKQETLFSDGDRYIAELPEGAFVEKAAETFMRYFPQSVLGGGLFPKKFKPSKKNTYVETLKDLRSLEALFIRHKNDEFVKGNGETAVLGACRPYELWVPVKRENARRDFANEPAFAEMWLDWFRRETGKSPERAQRMEIALNAVRQDCDNMKRIAAYGDRLFGKGFGTHVFESEYKEQLDALVAFFNRICAVSEDQRLMSAAVQMWIVKCVPPKDEVFDLSGFTSFMRYCVSPHLIASPQIYNIVGGCYKRGCAYEFESFALDKASLDYCADLEEKQFGTRVARKYHFSFNTALHFHAPEEYIYMCHKDRITERALYEHIFSDGGDALGLIAGAAAFYREELNARKKLGGGYYYHFDTARRITGKYIDPRKDIAGQLDENDLALLRFTDKLYETVIGVILPVELSRGDTPTRYSDIVNSIKRIYGIENFIAVLSALGKDAPERSRWYSTETKRASLSHLLSVCVPAPDDTAEKLGEALKSTDITEKRLIEAAMYSPNWLDMTGEYLGWEGFRSACWYFIAHMNESCDDRKTAVIAEYTPLKTSELCAGAFDINWFRSAYETIGEKRFNLIYDAAKYISVGSNHSRARKYADAVLGRLNKADTAKEIFEKRNKDLLMAYPLIPLDEKDAENDLCERYINLTKFLRESKKFGAQRSASESAAVGTAMQNLATRAGYSDVLRLTLRMETKLVENAREMFEEKIVDDVTVRLNVDENGKAEIVCVKDGKALKAVPARLKKDAYITQLSEMKKTLTEQYKHTKKMFEQSMEDETEYTVEEINILLGSPAAAPILKNLVFRRGKDLGFISGNYLIDYAGKKTRVKPDDKVVPAHTHALYESGHWQDYQKYLFERQTAQPFKQIFRELYVKTGEEAQMKFSLRYAGNQIQPVRAFACLQSRGWFADVYDGLEKVFYKHGISARILAMADWFSPSDIESPTLEKVVFFGQNSPEPLFIKDVPDVIFSEVMRDVDLAVSVAYAGQVDPETSHSTIEMRRALLEFTLPLFKLTNVEIKGTHAHIRGKLAEYTLHLGSGVVHKQGGAMIPILPVHSQHRGKLFLPFADDDPKTAEILSKAILLAEDNKIKDPMILEAVRR